MTISIITPILDHPEFCDAYERAVQGAECIIVDTGSTEGNRQRWMTIGEVIDYPHKGHNYGHWCNAGYARAEGDTIIFLNNDIETAGDWLEDVARDVRSGALYGPELQAQVVGGVKVPFLSGWCIAATRGTWAHLAFNRWPDDRPQGPWNTVDYPAAGYWEDNDLSFRAVMAGIELIQTRWPIRHLDGGNGTSKHKRDYYADVERNKATFEKAVREAMSHAAV